MTFANRSSCEFYLWTIMLWYSHTHVHWYLVINLGFTSLKTTVHLIPGFRPFLIWSYLISDSFISHGGFRQKSLDDFRKQKVASLSKICQMEFGRAITSKPIEISRLINDVFTFSDRTFVVVLRIALVIMSAYNLGRLVLSKNATWFSFPAILRTVYHNAKH